MKECPHNLKHTERLFAKPSKKDEKSDYVIEKTCADCGKYLGYVDIWYENK